MTGYFTFFLILSIDLAFLHYLFFGHMPGYTHFVQDWVEGFTKLVKKLTKPKIQSDTNTITTPSTFIAPNTTEKLPENFNIDKNTSPEFAAYLARIAKDNAAANERADWEKCNEKLERLQNWKENIQWISSFLLFGHFFILFLIAPEWGEIRTFVFGMFKD